ncbi:MAG: hypothetical protein ACR2PR_02155, partial [Pseudohongiellaceae bacterium]
MSNSQSLAEYPELVFGLVSPIGGNLNALTDNLSQSLQTVDYKTVNVKLTAEMLQFKADVEKPKSNAYNHLVTHKMDYATKLCQMSNNPSTMAMVAIESITRNRAKNSGLIDSPAAQTAYVVNQLKRPEEVAYLKRTYGKQFVLVSAYTAFEERFK